MPSTSGKRSAVPSYKKPIQQPVKSVVPRYGTSTTSKQLTATARGQAAPKTAVPSYMSMYAGPAPAGSTMFTPLSASQRDNLGGAARQAVTRAGQGLSSLVSGPYAQMALQGGLGASMPIEQSYAQRGMRSQIPGSVSSGQRGAWPMWAMPARRSGTWGDEAGLFHGKLGLEGKHLDQIYDEELAVLESLLSTLPDLGGGGGTMDSGYYDYGSSGGGGSSYNPYSWMSKLVSWNANKSRG